MSQAATMAKAYLAVTRLDFDAVATLLNTLPPMPDTNEFWSAHAYLIAIQRIQAGIPEAARTLIETLRTERRFSAASPLAARLLDEALFFAASFEPRVSILEFRYADSTLLAHNHLITGQSDAALAELD